MRSDHPAVLWLRAHGPRTVTALGFLVLHVLAGRYALDMLLLSWRLRLLLRLLADDILLFVLLHIPWFVIPAGLGAVTVLAAVEAGRVVWRWWRGQTEREVALRLRVLAYVAVACVAYSTFVLSTPEAVTGPFRVRFPIYAQFSVAFAYGAYALWWVVLPRLRRFFRERTRRGVDLIGMNASLVLVLAEITLRVVAAVWPSPLLATDRTPSQIRRNAGRQAPGVLRFGYPMNLGGHYDAEFVPGSASRNRVVVSIGDSFSYGVVPHAYHFTTVAERQLPGVDVYNMGYPGTGLSDYLYLLEHEALPLEPALVVIQVFVGNDIDEGPSPAGPARWYDADYYLLPTVWYRLRIMKRAELARAARPAAAEGDGGEDLLRDYPWLGDPLQETPHLGKDIHVQLESRNARSIGMADEGMYRRFFAELTALKRAAGDVPLAFVLIPDEFQVEDDLWDAVTANIGRPLDRDLAQRTALDWFAARGWPVLDLLPVLRAIEPMADGRRHLYHLRDTHFNARGNEVAGRALAGFIDSLLTSPPETAPAPPPRPPRPDVPLPFRLTLADSASGDWLAGGWHVPESAGGGTYRWSDGTGSELTVPLPTGADIRMEVSALPLSFRWSPEQRVEVRLNGTLVGTIRMRKGLRTYSVTLPAGSLVAHDDTIEFRYAWTRSPAAVLRGSTDNRQLAVAWFTIDFAPDTATGGRSP